MWISDTRHSRRVAAARGKKSGDIDPLQIIDDNNNSDDTIDIRNNNCDDVTATISTDLALTTTSFFF